MGKNSTPHNDGSVNPANSAVQVAELGPLPHAATVGTLWRKQTASTPADLQGFREVCGVMMPPAAADYIEAHRAEAIRRAVAIQGKDALIDPRRHAALHEAGHAVVNTLEGRVVKSVKVKAERYGSIKTWGGRTLTQEKPMVVDHTTSPVQDAVYLRVLLAGFISELLFTGKEFRLASSADETGLANIIARNIGVKTGEPATKIYLEACAYVKAVLEHNVEVVKAVAKKLMYERVLRGKPLQKLMAKVEKPSADSVKDAPALAETEAALPP